MKKPTIRDPQTFTPPVFISDPPPYRPPTPKPRREEDACDTGACAALSGIGAVVMVLASILMIGGWAEHNELVVDIGAGFLAAASVLLGVIFIAFVFHRLFCVAH